MSNHLPHPQPGAYFPALVNYLGQHPAAEAAA
jgi:hypothetical protein